MRIGIDMIGNQSTIRVRGIGRYVRGLVSNLVARHPRHEYYTTNVIDPFYQTYLGRAAADACGQAIWTSQDALGRPADAAGLSYSHRGNLCYGLAASVRADDDDVPVPGHHHTSRASGAHIERQFVVHLRADGAEKSLPSRRRHACITTKAHRSRRQKPTESRGN